MAPGWALILIYVKVSRGALAFSIVVGMLEGVAIMAALTAQACPSHMVRMMQRLGLEPGGGVVPHLSLSYITAYHRCEACPCKQACREWLDSAPASVLLAPRFCRMLISSLNCKLIDPARGSTTRAPPAGLLVREANALAFAGTDESDRH